jgi:hypothetical protein
MYGYFSSIDLAFLLTGLFNSTYQTSVAIINHNVYQRRWEDNIKMDRQEVGGGRGDWMVSAQDRDRWRALVGTVRNFRVP